MAGALAVALVAAWVTLAQPAVAGSEEPPDDDLPEVECPQFDGEPAAPDELTAYQYALACEVEVEVLDLRDVDRQVFATPDGLLNAEITVTPFWVEDGSGEWVDIDPTLVGQADGTATAAATVIDIEVGAGGADTFVTATDPDAGTLILTWPYGALPAPDLDGPVATYPEVLPGVDLAVQAEPVGFSWVLVVKTAAAAANPELAKIEIGIDTVGLELTENLEAGGLEVRDGSGEVIFETGQAIMWDSSVAGGEGAAATEAPEPTRTEPDPPAEPGRIGEVEVGIDQAGSGIDLVPDADMLADPDVTFPVYIDPPFTSSRQAWANVYNGARSRGWTGDSSWPRQGGMRVGLNTWESGYEHCGSGCGLWRSAITLNIGKLKGKHIASASVRALQTHTGGCGSYGLQLWRINKITNGVSWNGVTWRYGSPLQSRSVASSNTTGGCGSANPNQWVAFDNAEVRKRVQSAADQRYDTISFGFRSSSEGDRNAWRRIQTGSVALHVTYYLYPPKPDQRKQNGEACRTSAGAAPWVTTRTPTLSARARSQESESVYLRMRVRVRGADSNYWYYRTPSTVGSYTTVNRRLTTSLPDGYYTWQARTDSRQTDSVNSGYTNHCYFNVDATKPTVPAVTAPAGPFTEGQDVVLQVSATDPLVNGVHSGMARFEYSWTTPVYDRSVSASGSATITRSNAPAGRHVLYVRAVDKAGNISHERTHTFFVGRDIPATPMGMWRLDGDVLDDSGHGFDLAIARGTGPLFGPDREGRPGAALELDGSTCLTGPAPIRTDAAFTVALWARSDSANTPFQKILTQGAPAHSMYQVQYSTELGSWQFNLLSADYKWTVLRSAHPGAPGDWVHIAGTYDPDAELARLYVNGNLADEQAVDFEPWQATDTFEVGCLRQAGGIGHFLDGAIDGLGIWQGLLTRSQIQAAMTDLPVAAELARWEFRNGGEDSSGHGRNLEIPDGLTSGEDAFQRPNGALELDGETCLQYPEPIVDTRRSFAIGTWVRIDDIESIGAIASTFSASGMKGFELWASESGSPTGDFTLGMQNFPGDWSHAGGKHPVHHQYGDWHHVAFSYDAPSHTVSTYLDGERSVTVDMRDHPDAQVPLEDPFLIGCSYYPLSNGNGGYEPTETFHLDGALHDLRVWRGSLSPVQVASMVGNPPAELAGHWPLAGWGFDAAGHGHDLTFVDDIQFNDGWSCDPDGALELVGDGHAATAGPVVATDEAFTVAAWGRVDSLSDSVTFVSAAGHQSTGFALQYDAAAQRFQFVMASADVPSSTGGFSWRIARGGPRPEVDTWYHLVGVFDMAERELRLYLSGDRVASAGGPASPWRADGPVLLGISGTIDGIRWNQLRGAVDDVVMWRGAVPEHVIGQISTDPIPKC